MMHYFIVEVDLLNNVNIVMEAFRLMEDQWKSFTGTKAKDNRIHDKNLYNCDRKLESMNGIGKVNHQPNGSRKDHPTGSTAIAEQAATLKEFIDMMEAGFYFRVACTVHDEHISLGLDAHVECRVYLVQTQGGKVGSYM